MRVNVWLETASQNEKSANVNQQSLRILNPECSFPFERRYFCSVDTSAWFIRARITVRT